MGLDVHMVHMGKRKGALIALCFIIVLLVVSALYFFFFPSIVLCQASGERIGVSFGLRLKFAASGYRLSVLTLEGYLLDNPAGLENKISGVKAKVLLLSPLVTHFVQKTDFMTDYDGPVVMGICQNDERRQFDVIFQHSPLSGWEQVKAYIVKKNLTAVVVVTDETAGLEELFGDVSQAVMVRVQGGMRGADNASAALRSSGAGLICCPYLPDFAEYLRKCGPVQWIVDGSIGMAVNDEFILGTIQPDLHRTLLPLLKAGVRHSGAMILPLECRFALMH